jgi:transcriptional regulator with XRE-family HTH domain
LADLQLRAWRERKALSQRELAELAGVAPLSVTRIETGHQKARPSTVRKLAKALGLKPEQLFEGPG